MTVEEAIGNGGRLLKEGGADAVNLEGAGRARRGGSGRAGIPVMGHLGLTPQLVTGSAATGTGPPGGGRRAAVTGGPGARGRRRLRDGAGVCPLAVAAVITGGSTFPRSGSAPATAPTARSRCCTTCSASGAATARSPGSSSATPTSGPTMLAGVSAYADDVRARAYPAAGHTYSIAPRSSRRSRRHVVPRDRDNVLPTGSGLDRASTIPQRRLFLHTMVRITDPPAAAPSTKRSDLPSAASSPSSETASTRRPTTSSAFPAADNVLELTYNHDGRSYDLVRLRPHRDRRRDLDGTLPQLADQGIEPERPPYTVSDGGSRLCFVRDPDDYRMEIIGRK